MKKAQGFGRPGPPNLLQQALALARQAWESGKAGRALTLYQQILQQHPQQPEALHQISLILFHQGDTDQAVRVLAQAIRATPENAEMHLNLGTMLELRGQIQEAAVSFEYALQYQPNYAEAHTSLAGVLQLLGQPDRALTHYQQAIALRPEVLMAHDNYLMALQYSACLTPAHWQTALSDYHAQLPSFTPRPPMAHPRLRVGYVSADLYRHACAWFIEPLLAHHDHGQFEIFIYAGVQKPDEVTARLQTLADHWRDTRPMDDATLTKVIVKDEIDILVDLAGHTGFNRLPVFAQKAAPVQVSWLGFPGSTGLRAIDYRLSDPWLTPRDTPEYFSEQLWRLDRPAHCYRPAADAPEVNPLPALTKGYVTFGSFNNLLKVTPETLACWAELLHRVPESRLLLKAWQLANPAIRAGILQRLAVDPERVGLLGHQPTTAQHLSCYHEVDIALDTHPYHGTTTTVEALWMGVPVVSWVGERAAARVGLSFLEAVELGDLAVATPAAYVERALALVHDLEGLAHLRQNLRERVRQSPFCDEVGFTQAVEAAYRQMQALASV